MKIVIAALIALTAWSEVRASRIEILNFEDGSAEGMEVVLQLKGRELTLTPLQAGKSPLVFEKIAEDTYQWKNIILTPAPHGFNFQAKGESPSKLIRQRKCE